jgi:mannose-6-phosphate isomerase
MANSDNVVRGGLTSKHTDPAELVKILDFTPHFPDILGPGKNESSEKFYPLIAEEFVLSVISLENREIRYESRRSRSAEIMICTEGDALVKDLGRDELLEFRKGMSLFIPVSVKQYMIQGEATIYKASVPL